ncbi:tyrosine-type recombinase/integrase [Actinokineospora sp. UTMC 2448]|uniref:tyrosine-type recombinase/integrase n=1 Tax=Actinokineospora sp. UTMC 2448 TaxID=2268449 RepID=UPI0021640DA1|nr:tyrosine-type recombinase/integrase [Actinokineospora sp. UTMC 2448]UVS76330.1 Putative prophage phiRv2 integrase [Actinokineospora sp. UTMC 2448]
MGKRDWGRIRKLPSGRWQARYPGPDGRLRPADKTFDTKADAAAWLADKQSEINRDEWIDPDAGKIKLAEFGSRWIAERRLEETTRERYEIAFRVHVVPYLGDVELAKLKEGRVRTWRKTLEDEGVGKASTAKAYRVLRAILNTAVDDRLIRRNPCRIPKAGDDGSAERDAPTLDEVFALADAVPPRYRALVLLGAFTSLRFGELAALTVTSVDLVEGEVHVRKSQAELRGGRRLVKGPKSKAGVRIVAIPKAILDDVRAHVEQFSEPGADGRVFVGPLGGKLSRHNFRKVWVKALAESKIGKTDVHFHDLRHTGNNLAARAGATTRELMARMGHSSVRAALIYQHASREADRKIADSMSKAVRKARKAAKPKGHARGTPGDLAG